MFRKLLVALAFTFVPAVAMAQQHQHQDTAAKKHGHMMKMEHKGEHKDFAQQLIDKRADLNLTDAQVAKLRELSVKMVEHHKAAAKGANMDADAEGTMHVELLKIFNEEQLKQVRPLMHAHMMSMKCMDDDKQCKMEKMSKHKVTKE